MPIVIWNAAAPDPTEPRALPRYDLGDPVSLSVTVRDENGALANATTAVLTVTAPDGTTSTPTVSNPSTGVYTVAIAPAAVGRYVARWVATGANASAHTEEFEVIGGAPLLTVADLATHLKRAIASKDDPSATAAVNYATALVNEHIGFDVTTASFAVDGVTVRPTAEDVAVVRSVAVRVAAQWFTNPEDRASYSGPEGLSYTASPQMLSKIMSEVDRRTLLGVQLKYAPGFA